MKLYIKSDAQWLYPDEELLNTTPYFGETLEIHTAKGSPAGIQVLISDIDERVSILDVPQSPKMEVNVLKAVQVNFNTAGSAAEGFGEKDFVYLTQPEYLPKHCTRIAPFWVYDAYKPYVDELPEEGKQAFYLCFDVNFEVEAGMYEKKVLIKAGREEATITVDLHVYDTGLTRDCNFNVTNWFSVENMARFHGLEMYSEEHFAMINKYADAMLRLRQTHFMLTPELLQIEREGVNYQFDFTHIEQIADIFFAKGFRTMEFGSIGSRKRVHNVSLDVLGLEGVPVDSERGKGVLHQFFSGLLKVAKRKGWEDRVIFHLADEPDEPASAIEERLRQYGIMHDIMHDYFPNAKVCEAVKTAKFKDYIDILVPLSKTYENSAEEFCNAQREIWGYICCVPTGNYYQRFLDAPLTSPRMFFWSLAKHNLKGYLHWGLNYMEKDQEPFAQTNQYHTYGDGVCLPAGDSHMIYPEGRSLYYSMRMEACRKGAEEVEMLNVLKRRNPLVFEQLTENIRDFHGEYDDNTFEHMYRKLLCSFSKLESGR